MKIQESLEQLARYNLQQRTVASQVNGTTEKLKRFNVILDIFADEGHDRKRDPDLSVLAQMSAPIRSSLYGRILQALNSQKGAQGLMQLMPATARELGVADTFDIEQNIDGGAKYLRKMIDRYDGDLAKALAAYNAGPGTVDRFKGKVPYRETIAYVERVLKYSHHDA